MLTPKVEGTLDFGCGFEVDLRQYADNHGDFGCRLEGWRALVEGGSGLDNPPRSAMMTGMTRKRSPAAIIHKEIEPLGQGTMMTVDPTTCAVADVVVAYASINFLEKVIEKRKAELKPHLLSQAQTHGQVTEKGHSVLELEDAKVTRERKLSAGPDEDKLKRLLETYGLSLIDCFDEVKKVVLNPSKLQYLVDVGKLKGAEVEALRTESFALRVEPGPELKELLVLACGPEPEEKEERPGRRVKK